MRPYFEPDQGTITRGYGTRRPRRRSQMATTRLATGTAATATGARPQLPDHLIATRSRIAALRPNVIANRLDCARRRDLDDASIRRQTGDAN